MAFKEEAGSRERACRALHVGRVSFNGGQTQLANHRQIIEPSGSPKARNVIHVAVKLSKSLAGILVCTLESCIHQLIVCSGTPYPVHVSFERCARTSVGVSVEALIFPVVSKAAWPIRILDFILVSMKPGPKFRRIGTCCSPIPPLVRVAHSPIYLTRVPPSPAVMLPEVDEQKHHPERFVRLPLALEQNCGLQGVKHFVIGVRTSLAYVPLPYSRHAPNPPHALNHLRKKGSTSHSCLNTREIADFLVKSA